MFQRECYHGLNLRRTTVLLTVNPKLLFHEHMRNSRRASGPWESDEPVLINVTIGKIDQALVATSIVPVEVGAVEKRIHRAEQAFKPLRSARLFIGSRFIVVRCCEKSG